MSRFLTKQLENVEAVTDLATFEKVMRLRDMESKRVMSAGTKLRLTQQSRYTPKSGATHERKGAKAIPWQRPSERS